MSSMHARETIEDNGSLPLRNLTILLMSGLRIGHPGSYDNVSQDEMERLNVTRTQGIVRDIVVEFKQRRRLALTRFRCSRENG